MSYNSTYKLMWWCKRKGFQKSQHSAEGLMSRKNTSKGMTIDGYRRKTMSSYSKAVATTRNARVGRREVKCSSLFMVKVAWLTRETRILIKLPEWDLNGRI